MKHLAALFIALMCASCAYNSPGAKISTVITTNASLTPAGAPLIP